MATVYALACDVIKNAKNNNPDLLKKARELFVGIAFLYSEEKVKKSELDNLLFTIEGFIKQGQVSQAVYESDLPPASKIMFDRVFQSELDTQDIANCILINLFMRNMEDNK